MSEETKTKKQKRVEQPEAARQGVKPVDPEKFVGAAVAQPSVPQSVRSAGTPQTVRNNKKA